MGWDDSRPVPWRRLTKEWLIYAAIMLAIFLVFFRDRNIAGIVLGLLVSFPLWIGFSYVLAKFGYQRKSVGEVRAARTASAGATETTTTAAATKARPAPTKRTAGGPNRPTKKRK